MAAPSRSVEWELPMVVARDGNGNAAMGHRSAHVQKDESARPHANHELSEPAVGVAENLRPHAPLKNGVSLRYDR